MPVLESFSLQVWLLQWTPSRRGYLRFLAESKAVYDTLEQIVEEAPKPECKLFIVSAMFALSSIPLL